ncbi:MAG: glutaredoxin family protein [Cellvibrionaceae bacterium]
MQELILYSTLGCHLCELALDEISPCVINRDIVIKEVDIADDPLLLKEYGTSIPVAYASHTKKSLYWPFDHSAVKQFIDENY